MRLLLTLAWFGLTAWFLLSGRTAQDSWKRRNDVPVISARSIDPANHRKALEDPPRVVIGGIAQKCSDCHALFASLDVTPSAIRQHTDVVLDHGLNDRCFNCHAQEDRNRLVLRDGKQIGFSESSTLCSQCHGTLFRDWERGMHGRTVGSWDPDSGLQSRLRCVECHDPHAPAFGPLELLPAPSVRVRAEHPHEGPSEAQLRNPLERWKLQREGNARREATKD